MQHGYAPVDSFLQPSLLEHLCSARLQDDDLYSQGVSADGSMQLYRVLQATAQCCVDMHGRYATAAAHASQLAQCQLDFLPCLKVGYPLMLQDFCVIYRTLFIRICDCTVAVRFVLLESVLVTLRFVFSTVQCAIHMQNRKF